MSNPTANPTTPTAGEEVVWTGNISQWHYFGRWLLIVLLLAAAGASFVLPQAADLPYLWIGRGVAAGLAFILFLNIRIDRRGRKYTITNRRVSVEFGIFDKSSNEIRLQDIRSINLVQKGVAGFFGIGKVEFSSAARDDADVVFWNTPDSEKVRDLVRSLQSAA
jgi:uncharacterized membrane protein YdbT with pleckstrin-like domain